MRKEALIDSKREETSGILGVGTAGYLRLILPGEYFLSRSVNCNQHALCSRNTWEHKKRSAKTIGLQTKKCSPRTKSCKAPTEGWKPRKRNPPILYLAGDLRQIFANIIANAVDARKSGGSLTAFADLITVLPKQPPNSTRVTGNGN
jgi:hypothetical protein